MSYFAYKVLLFEQTNGQTNEQTDGRSYKNQKEYNKGDNNSERINKQK